MKNIFYILLLLPTIIFAQYPNNSGQKITLGEQTSADGLVYRGNAADTVAATLKITKTNKQDTSAFLLLDTINNVFLKYNIGTTYWTRLNILPTDTASMLGNYWRSGRFSGLLPVANGGTGSITQNFVDLTTTQSIGGTKSFTSSTLNLSDNNGAAFANFGTAAGRAQYQYNNFGGASASTYGWQFGRSASNGFLPDAFFIYNIRKNNVALGIDTNSNVGIGTNFTMPTEKLHVVGNARITGAYSVTTGSAANVFVTTDGVLQRSTSSIKYKIDVEDYSKGLKEVMQLRPVTFKSINSNNDKTYAGFIAEELADLKLVFLEIQIMNQVML